jgi:pyridoxamine 5'-phosphate oxidase
VDDPRSRPLREQDVDPDPFRQFRRWFDEARGVDLPEAAALATASADGRPSARMVLVKAAAARGFTFFSGYESRKGRELAANPRGALLFYWHPLGRQVRIEGTVERLSDDESDTYWQTRPPASRLSAAAVGQSNVVPSREALEDARRGLADPQRPPTWGGFLLVPDEYEFWQHRQDRLHDRLRYRVDRGRWVVERLAP